MKIKGREKRELLGRGLNMYMKVLVFVRINVLLHEKLTTDTLFVLWLNDSSVSESSYLLQT